MSGGDGDLDALWRWLDGAATPEEAARLSHRLAGDAAFRADYIAISRLHGALGEDRAAAMPRGRPLRLRRRRRRPVRWWLPAAAVLAVAALTAWWVRADRMPPVVAERVVPGGVPVPLAAGTVVVAADAPLELRLVGEETRLTLASGGTVVAAAAGDAWRLEHGAVLVEAAPRPSGRPLRIVTAHAEATVVGTRFSLEAGDATALRVHEGRVRLATANDRVECGPGEEAVAAPGEPITGGAAAVGIALAAADFEGADAGRGWLEPAIVAAPGGGRCIAATRRGDVVAARWEAWRDGIAAYDDALVVTARVWLSADAAWADLWLGHADGTGRHAMIGGIPRGRWWRIAVPLRDLRPLEAGLRTRPSRPGEPIAAVFFQAPAQTARLLVDDVRIVRP